MNLNFLKTVGDARLELQAAIHDFNQTVGGLLIETSRYAYQEFTNYFKTNGFQVSDIASTNPKQVVANYADIEIKFTSISGNPTKECVSAFRLFTDNNTIDYLVEVSSSIDMTYSDFQGVEFGNYSDKQSLDPDIYRQRTQVIKNRKTELTSVAWNYSARKNIEGETALFFSSNINDLLNKLFSTSNH